MKLAQIKQQVFTTLSVNNIKELRQQFGCLVQGKDLRKKAVWEELLSVVKYDLTLADIETEEALEQITTDFYAPDPEDFELIRINLESEFAESLERNKAKLEQQFQLEVAPVASSK